MHDTLKKQHYKFTLYHLETYYSNECKKVRWTDNSIYFAEKTWVNQSNYKEVFSLNFNEKKELIKFLRDRYKNDFYIYFSTTLGFAIKNNNFHNASEWLAIVSTATSENTLGFQLRERKKRNKFRQRKNSRYHDYYKSSYDWLAREIKRKKIDQFITDINQV